MCIRDSYGDEQSHQDGLNNLLLLEIPWKEYKIIQEVGDHRRDKGKEEDAIKSRHHPAFLVTDMCTTPRIHRQHDEYQQEIACPETEVYEDDE